MIVKNEEANLPACLESVRDLFHEVIVVDTGSTDRTKEIAASFGARVFDFPWVDNFAAARNAAPNANRRWEPWQESGYPRQVRAAHRSATLTCRF